MTAITYKPSPGRCSIERVYLSGKLVGYIRQDSAGYYYEPIGGTSRGRSFETIRLVHRSLED